MNSISEINSQTLRAWQEQGKKIRLVDVRSHGEFMQGVIEGGEFLPLNLLPVKKDELTSSNEEIVFYCRSGARSAQACWYMMQNGYDQVHNLRGGIIDWVRTGLPISVPANAV